VNPQALPFAISALCGLLVWAAVSARYIWPKLRGLELRAAAEPILYLHLFRFIGLAFIAKGVVSSEMPLPWSQPAAYGDLGAALLAALALVAAHSKLQRVALWIFNLWGSYDLLHAAATGPMYDVPGYLQSTFFIPVLGVPLLLCTHAILFVLLLRRKTR
jgi:hypothetical protein